jgi:hypothetical protein
MYAPLSLTCGGIRRARGEYNEQAVVLGSAHTAHTIAAIHEGLRNKDIYLEIPVKRLGCHTRLHGAAPRGELIGERQMRTRMNRQRDPAPTFVPFASDRAQQHYAARGGPKMNGAITETILSAARLRNSAARRADPVQNTGLEVSVRSKFDRRKCLRSATATSTSVCWRERPLMGIFRDDPNRREFGPGG